MPHRYCQTNRQMSMSMVSPNQPQYQETVLESFQQLRVQPTYFLVGVIYCLVNVPLTILIPNDQYLHPV